MKINKILHCVGAATLTALPIISLTNCNASQNHCILISKDISGQLFYGKQPKFIIKLDSKITDNTTFKFETSNIKIFDRFNNSIIVTNNEIFDFKVNETGIDNTIAVFLSIKQSDKIYSGCIVKFNLKVSRFESQNEIWNTTFNDCSVTYKCNLIVDDTNFITIDQCNSGTVANYSIQFPTINRHYRPNPDAIQINNYEHASLSGDYQLFDFYRGMKSDGTVISISFSVKRTDGKAFQEGEIIPFYLDLSYEDPREVENSWQEFIPYLYLKHTEIKIKEVEKTTVTIPKPTAVFYQIFSTELNFVDGYEIDAEDIVEISFSYPKGRDQYMGWFNLTTSYVVDKRKKYHIDYTSLISNEITVGEHELEFNVYFENKTAKWKQVVPVTISYVIQE